MYTKKNIVSISDVVFPKFTLSDVTQGNPERGIRRFLKNYWRLVPVISLALILIVVIAGGYYYSWSWVGVVEYSYDKGVIKEISHVKTLWDWFDLLFIPMVLALGAWWLNKTEKDTEQRNLEERLTNERRIAHERQQHTILQSYIEKISDLLLNHQLRTSHNQDEVRIIARTTTLTALRALDGLYKAQIVKFLYESHLISTDEEFISLQGADLSHVYLAGENLTKISLSGAILTGANFEQADLSFANLESTKFTGLYTKDDGFIATNLREINLSHANLHRSLLAGYDLIDMEVEGEFEAMGADLSEANLTSANLRSANFVGNYRILGKSSVKGSINFKGANLMGANLSKADLTDALVWKETLDMVKTLEGATLPSANQDRIFDRNKH